MSFYAFIIGWLLPSLPLTIKLKMIFILTVFMNFNLRFGLFPSRLITLALLVCLLKKNIFVLDVF
jgi:hypothetical protein